MTHTSNRIYVIKMPGSLKLGHLFFDLLNNFLLLFKEQAYVDYWRFYSLNILNRSTIFVD